MEHQIDQLEAQRREIVAALRERIIASGIKRHTLAVAAGLSERALKAFDRPEWNPNTETIRKVDSYLRALAEGRTNIRFGDAGRKGQGNRPKRPAGAAA